MAPILNRENKQPAITVTSKAWSYPIYIEERIIPILAEYLKDIKDRHFFIFCDENTKIFLNSGFRQQLQSKGAIVKSHIFPAGESTKSFSMYEQGVNFLLENNARRDSCLIALGGGVVGDLTGFIASTLLRGVDFIQIPTSLLAQVDSSVGGKTGINTDYGKNLVGAFYQPKAVMIDLKSLNSLPEREFAAGMAEVIKYALLGNEKFLCWLEKNLAALYRQEESKLKEAIKMCCEMKADIVAKDEKETSGVRALLNLGHTFGHAIEKLAGYNGSVLHGEAVAIGMVMAAELSHIEGLISTEDVKRVRKIIKNARLPQKTSFDADNIYNSMQGDKKADRTGLNLVLLNKIGEAAIYPNIDKKNIMKAITACT
tara:strand:+ start:1653 stop:2765 length:1113 start_codon:yes stop_codon:yes gene_type:complete